MKLTYFYYFLNHGYMKQSHKNKSRVTLIKKIALVLIFNSIDQL